MTSAQLYIPAFASEKLLTPPYKGCGISADWTGTALATLGESTLQPNGRVKNKGQRKADLQRGWNAFTRVADSNGIPDTDDAIRIHSGMFPKLPNPDQLWTRNWDDVIDQLDDDMAISIALRLSALPSDSPLRRYTSADHQITMWKRKGDTVKRPDPMHNHSNTYGGERVPLKDIRIAAKAIEKGLILTWLFPIGEWTAEALMRAKKNRIMKLREDAAKDTQKRLRARIKELEESPGTDCSVLIAKAVDAAILEADRVSSEAIQATRAK